jgi:hypothetical protein
LVHVTQENVEGIDVDLLIHECLRANQGKDSFAYIVSPFIADFPLVSSWLSFVSNVIEVSDIDSYVDLIGLVRHYGVFVKVVTRSPRDLERTTISRNFIERHSRILSQMSKMGCEIRTNSSLHAKATVSSRGVLSGSFNLTMSGRGLNVEAGFYFSNIVGTEKEEYDAKLGWVKELFEGSTPITKQTLANEH